MITLLTRVFGDFAQSQMQDKLSRMDLHFQRPKVHRPPSPVSLQPTPLTPAPTQIIKHND